MDHDERFHALVLLAAGTAMRYHLRRTGDLLAARFGGGATPG